MIYSDFKGKKLPYLGFGCMRLPQTEDKKIDSGKLQEMVDYAMANGVNYFDTAYTYHGGTSEVELGKALKKYPRESFYLCNKYPGHQAAGLENPPAMFQSQLDKCGVEYFDFCVIHNVCEATIGHYFNESYSIVETLMEERRKGRIKHLGFSCHGDLPVFHQFLERYGREMEFCILQMNYVDWTLQHTKEKYELVTEWGIPVWIMEPIRGGKLAERENGAEMALRWTEAFDNVKVVLSGMSNLEQMKENIETLSERRPLTEEENQELYKHAETLTNLVPCTNCNYCTGCPMELNIPRFIEILNNNRIGFALNQSMRIEQLEENRRPSACIGCGICLDKCPQKIDIPAAMNELAERFRNMPKWDDFFNGK